MAAACLGPGRDGNHAPGQVHAGAAWRACIRLQTPAPGSRGMHSPLLPNAGAPCGTEFRDCAVSTALISRDPDVGSQALASVLEFSKRAPFTKGEDLREKELGEPLLAFVTSRG
ncbi:unnamed protein product [Rangifer tarandus platyrhynchus]|uniref:Uncharacterized protein n=1 Tax=Rangifer tarandus platyrhynchus TaxID=3082113 RepID=A0AC59YZ39_RANTA